MYAKYPVKILARLIRHQLHLETNELGHCAVYEKELQRVWPLTEENRKAKIAHFAERHGFRLVYYKQGLCAIFVEESIGPQHYTRQKRRTARHGLKSPAQRQNNSNNCANRKITNLIDRNFADNRSRVMPDPSPGPFIYVQQGS